MTRKHNKPPISDFLGQQLMALHKYYYFSKAGFMLLSEQPDGTGRTLIGEDPNLSYLIYMHRAYSFHHVKEIYDYYGKTCLVIIPPDDGEEVSEE